jgi:drug/metabolite transporter (DMT)-like permease
VIAAALILGVFSYGVSILLDAYALRHIGAAREAAFFATAPFMGAIAAIPILGERPRAILPHEHPHVSDLHHRHVHVRKRSR